MVILTLVFIYIEQIYFSHILIRDTSKFFYQYYIHIHINTYPYNFLKRRIKNQKMSKSSLKSSVPKQEDDPFNSISFPPLIFQKYTDLSQNIRSICCRVREQEQRQRKFKSFQTAILCNFLKYYYQYFQFKKFDPSYSLWKAGTPWHTQQNILQIIFYENISIFQKQVWPLGFHQKFIKRIEQKMYKYNQILYVLSFILLLADGKFYGKDSLPGKYNKYGFVIPIKFKCFPYNRFFYMKIHENKNILFSVGVEKKPTRFQNYSQFDYFSYSSYIYIIDILQDNIVNTPMQIEKILQEIILQLQRDVARKDHQVELILEKKNYHYCYFEKNSKYLFQKSVDQKNQIYIAQTEVDPRLPNKFTPCSFKSVWVYSTEKQKIFYDTKLHRWFSLDSEIDVSKDILVKYQRVQRRKVFKKIMDMKNTASILSIFNKIGNFKIQLSKEQKEIIAEQGNFLVLGRSGTGKTTCSILRLFATQVLFRVKLSLYKNQIKEKKQSQEIADKIGLHCIMLTASPVLTNQIERYYNSIKDKFQKEIEKRKKEKQDKNQNLSGIKQQGFIQVPSQLQSEGQITPLSEILSSHKQQHSKINSQYQRNFNEQNESEKLYEDHQETEDKIKKRFEEKMKKFKSLNDLEESDYPGFFTTRNFIMMIDGTLDHPFFARKSLQATIQSQSSWHNQKKGVMVIEKYYRDEGKDKFEQLNQEEINFEDQKQLQDQYLRNMQDNLNKQKRSFRRKKNKKNKGFQASDSFQVDYDYFETHFWPHVKIRGYSEKNITPHLIWTEIYSIIKGNLLSYNNRTLSLTLSEYNTIKSFLSQREKLIVYNIFKQYEKWKKQICGYDLMDAVNYILKYIRTSGYHGPDIHYLFVDEVQDLPQATLFLLSIIVKYGIFYSGDTAQTIAKGSGFRFCDIKNIFTGDTVNYRLTEQYFKKPIMKQLTVNYRSHNNILKLANSIITSLQIIFPQNIDRLNKQTSNLSGPKPILLFDNDQQVLFQVLCGYFKEERKIQESNELKKPSLQFGCDQVILVRDQQSKKKIPPLLQHALCLTVYQSKGLQFNDVILFNFFSESKCSVTKWSLLRYLKVIETEVSLQQYEKSVTKHSKQMIKINDGIECNFDRIQGSVRVKSIIKDIGLNNKDLNDFGELCSQLKVLYTAITRSKNSIIIYDQDSTLRKPIQKLWQQLDVVQFLNKEGLRDNFRKRISLNQKNVATLPGSLKEKREGWKDQGMKMYSRGHFQQAAKCFVNSGDDVLYRKAMGNKQATKAGKKLIEIDAERNAIAKKSRKYVQMTKSQISRIKKNLKREQKQAYKLFYEAGSLFQSIGMCKQAGKCYFSAKKYEDSYKIFSKVSMYYQAGESLQMLKKYIEAAQYYKKCDNYIKIIQCLQQAREWEQILRTLKIYSNKIPVNQKKSYYWKYSFIAFQQLLYQIEFQNELEEIRQQKNCLQIIKENRTDQQDEDEDDVNEVVEKVGFSQLEIDNNEDNNQKIDSSFSFCDLNDSIDEDNCKQKDQIEHKQLRSFLSQASSPKILNNKKVQEVDKRAENNNSFQILDKDDYEAEKIQQCKVIPNHHNLLPDIQSIKSQVDSEDVWVHIALSQMPVSKTYSQYSVIDNSQFRISNTKVIKTKGNIIAEDNALRKIAEIASILKEEGLQFFNLAKRSDHSQEQYQEKQENNNSSNYQIISDFEIDSESINLILDLLESMKLYKLCLFVCNRYNLVDKISQYLMSIALKYSTNSNNNNQLKPLLAFQSQERKAILEKGILGSITMHTILENVSPEFLTVKIVKEDKQLKTLGIYFIQGLILQGLYKKVAFMVDPQESLKILRNYLDNKMYLQFYVNTIQRNKVKQKPINQKEISQQYLVVQLEQKVRTYIIDKRLNMISSKYFKQISNFQQQRQNFQDTGSPLLKILFQLSDDPQNKDRFAQLLSVQLKNCMKHLIQGSYQQIYDTVSFITIVINNQQLYPLIFKLKPPQFLQFLSCVRTIRKTLIKCHMQKSYQIIQSVLSVYWSRIITPCQSMKFIGQDYSMIHRGSALVKNFMEQLKKNNNESAFFIEQDYNCILVRTSKLLQLTSKKFDSAYFKFIQHKISYGQKSSLDLDYKGIYLSNDFKDLETQCFICELLKLEKQGISNKISKKIIKKNKIDSKRSNKNLEFCYWYRYKGTTQYLVSQEPEYDLKEDQQIELKLKVGDSKDKLFFFPELKGNFHQVSDLSISAFYNQVQEYQDRSFYAARLLYSSQCSNILKEFRYNKKIQNLYNALQFRKFGRLDYYADNILSVINELTPQQRQMFSTQIIILLIIQYRCANEKEFFLQFPAQFLKFLPTLQLQEVIQNGACLKSIDSSKMGNYISSDKSICTFTYQSHFSTQDKNQTIVGMIYTFLRIIMDQEDWRYVSKEKILLVLLVNLRNCKQILKLTRDLIADSESGLEKQFFSSFQLSSSIQDLGISKVDNEPPINQLVNFHKVKVIDVSNVQLNIERSLIDYKTEQMKTKLRVRAVKKIESWWKQIKCKKGQLNETKLIKQARIFKLTKGKDRINYIKSISFLFKSAKLRQTMLNSYLTSQSNSPGNFHFVLSALNKIDDIRQNYLQSKFKMLNKNKTQMDHIDKIEELEKQFLNKKTQNKQVRVEKQDIGKRKIFKLKWLTRNLVQKVSRSRRI